MKEMSCQVPLRNLATSEPYRNSEFSQMAFHIQFRESLLGNFWSGEKICMSFSLLLIFFSFGLLIKVLCQAMWNLWKEKTLIAYSFAYELCSSWLQSGGKNPEEYMWLSEGLRQYNNWHPALRKSKDTKLRLSVTPFMRMLPSFDSLSKRDQDPCTSVFRGSVPAMMFTASQRWVRHVSHPAQILYERISESSLSICALPSPWQPRIFSEKSASH